MNKTKKIHATKDAVVSYQFASVCAITEYTSSKETQMTLKKKTSFILPQKLEIFSIK